MVRNNTPMPDWQGPGNGGQEAARRTPTSPPGRSSQRAVPCLLCATCGLMRHVAVDG
jgi:hypothetical protein